ncbi:MAG TPA: hypothetical protein VNV16_14890, partial [Methylibium sp.]|nr:hypothetical protein [Methylibium sp.]
MGGSSKRVTVGFRYYMTLHFAACYGPVDRFLRFLVGDRVAWNGSIESNGAIDVNAPQLFGGDEREGGIVGSMRVLMGGSAQTLPDVVAARLPSPSPAFRGVLSFFYRGQISANNPYVKPFAFTLTRVLQGWHGGTAWYPETAPVPIFAEGQSASTLASFQSNTHFSYTGTNQEWTVPEGVTEVTIKAWGGGGHGGVRGTSRPAIVGTPNTYGGGGGFSRATFAVTPGQVLTIRVGGGGRKIVAGGLEWSAGGWPSGGQGGIRDNGAAAGGGGADSRVVG